MWPYHHLNEGEQLAKAIGSASSDSGLERPVQEATGTSVPSSSTRPGREAERGLLGGRFPQAIKRAKTRRRLAPAAGTLRHATCSSVVKCDEKMAQFLPASWPDFDIISLINSVLQSRRRRLVTTQRQDTRSSGASPKFGPRIGTRGRGGSARLHLAPAMDVVSGPSASEDN